MKFSIDASELNHIINIALKGISSRSTLPILSGFLLEAENNKLIITSTDLELGIRTYTPCNIFEEGRIVVPARFFSELVKKLPDENIVFESKIDLSIHISCTSSDFNLIGLDPMEFPSFQEIEDEKQIVLPSHVLSSMIKQTNFATSVDESRPILTGALFEFDENAFYMVALDGYRLAYRQENLALNIKEQLVVPSKTLNEIQKLLDDNEDIIKIVFNNSHIRFEIGKTIFVSRLLEGQFLNYRDVIQMTPKTKIEIDLKTLKHSLDRASLFAKEGKNNCVKLEIKDGKLSISSQSELGNVLEVLDVKKEGEDLVIAFNAKYMADGLKSIEDKEVTLEFMSSVNPCIIKPKNSDAYLYLMLPVRLVEA